MKLFNNFSHLHFNSLFSENGSWYLKSFKFAINARKKFKEDNGRCFPRTNLNTSFYFRTSIDWDIFMVRPWDNTREQDEKVVARWLKIFKVTTYIAVFIGMLIFLFLSKVSLLIASTNIRAYPQNYSSLNKLSNFSRSVRDLRFSGYYPDNSRPTLQCYNYTFYYPVFFNFSGFVENKNATKSGTYCMLMPNHFNTTMFNGKNMTCTNVDRWHPRHSNQVNGYKFNSTDIKRFYATPCISVHFRWMWAVFLMICLPYAIISLRCFWKVSLVVV